MFAPRGVDRCASYYRYASVHSESNLVMGASTSCDASLSATGPAGGVGAGDVLGTSRTSAVADGIGAGFRFDFKTSPASSARYPVAAVLVYLCVIFGLQRVMRGRPAMKLRTFALVHNVILCLLSLAMAVGTLVEVLIVISRSGPFSVVCDNNGSAMGGRLGAWMYLFYLSKFYELLDTLLMVLKKRNLNFLHVYHHSVVLPLFYVYMRTGMVFQWILVIANSAVHVAMYYYYACATVGKKVWWKKYITQAQIVQFIIDLTATWPYPFLYFTTGCSGNMRGWLFGQAVGASFFKLFSDFYSRSYAKAKAKAIEAEHQAQTQSQARADASASEKSTTSTCACCAEGEQEQSESSTKLQ